MILGRDFLDRKDNYNKGPEVGLGLAIKPEDGWIAVTGERS